VTRGQILSSSGCDRPLQQSTPVGGSSSAELPPPFGNNGASTEWRTRIAEDDYDAASSAIGGPTAWLFVVQGGSNIPKQPDDVESVNGKPLPEVACDYGLISRSWFVLWSSQLYKCDSWKETSRVATRRARRTGSHRDRGRPVPGTVIGGAASRSSPAGFLNGSNYPKWTRSHAACRTSPSWVQRSIAVAKAGAG
jgi:hypothetical protein